jgi:MFS family permease
VAVVGCLAFSLATSFSGLLAARVLCGVGVSACLMAPLTGFRRWFEPTTQLRANSWMLMTGSLGMVASTLPVQWLVPLAGWRPLFWGSGTALLCCCPWRSLPGRCRAGWWRPLRRPAPLQPKPCPGGYAAVWRNPYFRRMTPIGFFSYGGMIAMQTLWAGPWMVKVAGYDPLDAAQGLFWINVSMLCTFWSWGLLNPLLARRGFTTERLIAWGLPLSFVVLASTIAAGPLAGAGAWALFCMTSTFVSLAQPAVGMAFPPALAGRALVGLQPGHLCGRVYRAVGHWPAGRRLCGRRARHRWVRSRPPWACSWRSVWRPTATSFWQDLIISRSFKLS